MSAIAKLKAALLGKKDAAESSRFDLNPLCPHANTAISVELLIVYSKNTDSGSFYSVEQALNGAFALRQLADKTFTSGGGVAEPQISSPPLSSPLLSSPDLSSPLLPSPDLPSPLLRSVSKLAPGCFPCAVWWPSTVACEEARAFIDDVTKLSPPGVVCDFSNAESYSVAILRLPGVEHADRPVHELLTVEFHRFQSDDATIVVPYVTKQVVETKTETLGRLLSHRQPVTVSIDGTALTLCERGVDATGIVRRWLSEDILAQLIFQLSQSHSSSDARLLDDIAVAEIGAGKSGLAGYILGACARPRRLCITDGNTVAVKTLNLQGLLFALGYPQASGQIESECVVWDIAAAEGRIASGGAAFPLSPLFQSPATGGVLHSATPKTEVTRATGHLDGSFDLVIAADTTFFEDFHKDQIYSIYVLLAGNPAEHRFGDTTDLTAEKKQLRSMRHLEYPKSQKQAWLFAPSRGGSMERFAISAANFHVRRYDADDFTPAFRIRIFDEYDDAITVRRQLLKADPDFCEDIHYPLLLVMELIQ